MSTTRAPAVRRPCNRVIVCGVNARTRAVAVFGLWWGGWGALLPSVQRSAGVDDGQLGAGLLLVGAGALASMRMTGYLVDRIGGAVLIVAVASLGLAGIGPGVVHGAGPLAASMALLGAASGAYDVAMNAEASGIESTSARPLLSLAHAGFSFGVIAGALVSGTLQALDVSAARSLCVIGLALAVAAACLSRGRPSRPRGDVTVSAGVAAARWRWWRPPRRIAVLGGLLALGFLVESAWQTWSAVHLERDLGTSAALASLGPAVFGASAGIGRLLVHRLTAPGRETRLVSAGATAAAAGSLAAALLPVTPLVLAAVALVGLGTAAAAPSLLGMAGRSVSAGSSGAAVGTVTTLGYLGFVIAPAVIGGLAGATTLPTALAAIAVIALALAGGAAWMGQR